MAKKKKKVPAKRPPSAVKQFHRTIADLRNKLEAAEKDALMWKSQFVSMRNLLRQGEANRHTEITDEVRRVLWDALKSTGYEIKDDG